MAIYLRDTLDRQCQAWEIDTTSATRLGVTNPLGSPGCYFRADHAEDIFDALRRQASSWFGPNGEDNPFHKVARSLGEFYPRIARPIDPHINDPARNPGAKWDDDNVAIGRSQLVVIARQLDRICQTVHPTETTFQTFGHDIRNLLILACTEVEAHWRGVLVANGVKKERFSTNDYAKLEGPMKLAEYGVSFPSYPWLRQFKPFLGWRGSRRPTSDLRWYDAYNSVKHDREASFKAGTLEHLFHAISACVIMMVAQYGERVALAPRSELSALVQVASRPNWSFVDAYISPYGNLQDGWFPSPVPLPT